MFSRLVTPCPTPKIAPITRNGSPGLRNKISSSTTMAASIPYVASC